MIYRASFYDNKAPEDLLSANYTGILLPKFFVEAQFSRRRNFFIGSGARFTDVPRGTMILDRSRGNARWNSPTFCGVCGLSQADIDADKLNEEFRGNKNAIVKGSYFLSTPRAGSHSLVFGGVRAPWRAEDVTLTLTPGRTAPCASTTWPVMLPVGVVCAQAPVAWSRTVKTTANTFDRMSTPSTPPNSPGHS